jgi:large subunit ribosomal protein L10
VLLAKRQEEEEVANQRNLESLTSLRKSLEGQSSFYVVNYQGLTSEGLGGLRKELRNVGARLVVAKNTLINLAIKDKGFEMNDLLKGPSALVLVGEDAIGPVKALVDYAKKNDKGIPNAKGGVLDGAVIDAKRFEDIASLPSKDVLRSELLGVLEAVPSQLVSVLGGKQQEFVGILDAKVQQASA